MMSFKSHISFHLRGAPQDPLIRRLSHFLLTFLLILTLVGGPVTDTPSLADNHLAVAVDLSVDGPQSVPACDPEVLCSAYMLPAGPATAYAAGFALAVRLTQDRQQRRLATLLVDTPPPRRMT